MNDKTKKPLWKALNEQRTQGEWETEQCGGRNDHDHAVFSRNGGRNGSYVIAKYGWQKVEKKPEEIKANAQYTTLAVNNLASVAEALEKALHTIELLAEEANYQSPRWTKEHIVPIQEALNRIS